jgi:hypothetical protein
MRCFVLGFFVNQLLLVLLEVHSGRLDFFCVFMMIFNFLCDHPASWTPGGGQKFFELGKKCKC